MRTLLKITIAVLVLLYPIAIYFGLQHFEPKILSLILAALVVIRALFTNSRLLQAIKGLWLIVFIAGITIAGLSFFNNTELGLKLYPAVISTSFLAVFAYSLVKPPSIIERLARLQQPDLPESGVNYTQNVTKIWCGFFIFNITVSLYTVFYTDTAIWTLYNGLISYLLMGLLFGTELMYRKWRLKAE